MDAWTFIWLMVALKLPIVALFLIVRWAVRQTPEEWTGEDGGIGPRPGPAGHPHRPRPRPRVPRAQRRDPHGGPAPAAPQRIRAASGRRLTRS